MTVTGPNGQKLSSGNLINESKQWQFPHGRWNLEDGVIRPRGNSLQTWALAGDPAWRDYTVTLRARKLGGNEGFIVLWHAADGDNYRWWNIGGWGNTLSRCEMSESGGREAYGPGTPFTVETDRWYDLKLVVTGHTARGYIDGKLTMEATDVPHSPIQNAFASASYINSTGEMIVKVVNTSGTPLETEIRLKDAAHVESGKVTMLTGEPSAVNTVSKPTTIAPTEAPLVINSASFNHIFPRYSVTIMRFPAKK
jgi:alpha-L-arabinofuranosidase